jgi:hypothetical protein
MRLGVIRPGLVLGVHAQLGLIGPRAAESKGLHESRQVRSGLELGDLVAGMRKGEPPLDGALPLLSLSRRLHWTAS